MFDSAQQARRRAFLQGLRGRDVEVRIRAPRKDKSHPQLGWWWGVFLPQLAEALGYERDELEELHYGLCAKCWGTHYDRVLLVEVANHRMSKSSTKDMSDLMDWGVRWAAKEHGLVISLPDER